MDFDKHKTLAAKTIGTSEEKKPGETKSAPWFKNALDNVWNRKMTLSEGLVALSLVCGGAAANTASCAGPEFRAGESINDDASSDGGYGGGDANPEISKDVQHKDGKDEADVVSAEDVNVEAIADTLPEVIADVAPEKIVDAPKEADVSEEESGPVSAWMYKVKCDVNTGVTVDLNNFPVHCDLDTAALITANKMRADCLDIRVEDKQHNPLSYEIENGTCNTNGTTVWLKLPVAKNSVDNNVYLLYGNLAAIDGQDAKGVWSNGFVGVWHFGETQSSFKDSAGNNDLQWQANPSTQDGLFGKGARITGIGGMIAYTGPMAYKLSPVSLPASNADYTMSIWEKFPTYTTLNQSAIMSIGKDGNKQSRTIWKYEPPISCSGAGITGLGQDFGSYSFCTKTSDYTNQWINHTVSLASGNQLTFINGNLLSSAQTSGLNTQPVVLTLGALKTTGPVGEFFYAPDAYLDEARISTVARSSDWMKAEYTTTTKVGPETPNQ